MPNVQVQGQRIIQQGLIRVANVPNTNVLVNIPQVRSPLLPPSDTERLRECGQLFMDPLDYKRQMSFDITAEVKAKQTMNPGQH